MAVIVFQPVAAGVKRYCNELSSKNAAAIGYKLPNKPADATEWSFTEAEPERNNAFCDNNDRESNSSSN